MLVVVPLIKVLLSVLIYEKLFNIHDIHDIFLLFIISRARMGVRTRKTNMKYIVDMLNAQ